MMHIRNYCSGACARMDGVWKKLVLLRAGCAGVGSCPQADALQDCRLRLGCFVSASLRLDEAYPKVKPMIFCPCYQLPIG